MKTLKQIYIQISKKAGFTESDLPEITKVIVKKWLKQRQNGWVTGSEVWKEYQELLKELE